MVNRRARRHPNDVTPLNKAYERFDSIAEALLHSNKECLIPEDESIPHNEMNNCHIIPQPFLALIAADLKRKKRILCWPASIRSLGREAASTLRQAQLEGEPLQNFVTRYEPTDRDTGHRDVKFTFACTNHDNTVFKCVDSVCDFNIEDKETQFKLGLRTMAAYTALYQGYTRWVQGELKNHRDIPLILTKYHGARVIFDRIMASLETFNISIGLQIEMEMKRWQAAYQQSAWQRAITTTRTITPKLQIAATGIVSSCDCHVALTILPTPNHKCLIVTTVLEYDTPVMSTQTAREAIDPVATEWATTIGELRPKEWLPKLKRHCEFLYVSPDDYRNDEIISSEERLDVEQEIAQGIPIA